MPVFEKLFMSAPTKFRTLADYLPLYWINDILSMGMLHLLDMLIVCPSVHLTVYLSI